MNQISKGVMLAVLVAGLTTSSSGAEKHGSLTNLVNLLEQAETVTLSSPTNAATELSWLVGRWECADRALRTYPPTGFSGDNSWIARGDYPWLKVMEITDTQLRASATNSGSLKLSLSCDFQVRPGANGTRVWATTGETVAFELAGKDLKYRATPAHLFWLKRENALRPRWLLLENQENGELLLFRRVEASPSVESKR